jgi:hypothetical protein
MCKASRCCQQVLQQAPGICSNWGLWPAPAALSHVGLMLQTALGHGCLVSHTEKNMLVANLSAPSQQLPQLPSLLLTNTKRLPSSQTQNPVCLSPMYALLLFTLRPLSACMLPLPPALLAVLT